MKILRPFTGTGAIFFPLGRPPIGTCQNATNKCINDCYQLNPKRPNYDEEIRINQDEKRQIYNIIINSSITSIITTFIKELNGLQTNILHWFGSGDCLDRDIEKISAIVGCMKKYKYIKQMGFTRNEHLWRLHKDIFALSVDNKEQAIESGLYSIPNYEMERSIMFNPEHEIKGGLCGPDSCDDIFNESLNHYVNCKTCVRLKTGCFDKR